MQRARRHPGHRRDCVPAQAGSASDDRGWTSAARGADRDRGSHWLRPHGAQQLARRTARLGRSAGKDRNLGAPNALALIAACRLLDWAIRLALARKMDDHCRADDGPTASIVCVGRPLGGHGRMRPRNERRMQHDAHGGEPSRDVGAVAFAETDHALCKHAPSRGEMVIRRVARNCRLLSPFGHVSRRCRPTIKPKEQRAGGRPARQG